MSGEVQTANLAGRWYADDPGKLRADVEALLDSPQAPDPALRAMIVPHAAYQYSGRAAGSAFSRVERGRWRRAVVIGPSHRHGFSGAALFSGEGFETPLGVLAVDRPGVRDLAACPGFRETSRPYAGEHSIEIQIPFLQVVDPEIRIVPVLIGMAEGAQARAALAGGLRALEDGQTLFVVSSDFTHYGAAFDYLPFPPDDVEAVSEQLRRLDFGAIEPILAGDGERFAEFVRQAELTVCGRLPIAIFLRLAAGRFRGELSSYYTSLDLTGDREHSVSYAAIVFRLAPEAIG